MRCSQQAFTQRHKADEAWLAVCSVVDFGAGWFDLNWAFAQQRAMNAPGQSPPMCSEF